MQTLGKITTVAEGFPVFIVNRVLVSMINKALYALDEGIGSVIAIDTSMRLAQRLAFRGNSCGGYGPGALHHTAGHPT